MKREILTHPISKEAMWDELSFFVQRLQELGQRECTVLFGFAWGSDYYPTATWDDVAFSVAKVIEEVRRVETAKFGKLGSDDLFIRVPSLGVEFRFCNDSDIHVAFDHPNDMAEFFYERWRKKGFKPAEWDKTEGQGPGIRLREN